MAKIASKVIADNGEGVRIAFTDGKVVEVSVEELSDEIKGRLVLHGLSQKLGDAYSGCGGRMAEAFAECQSTAEALVAGNWNRRGDGMGGADLTQALADVQGRSLEEAQEVIAGLSKDDRDGLKKHPKIKARMAALKAERLEAKAEGGEDLDGLFK